MKKTLSFSLLVVAYLLSGLIFIALAINGLIFAFKGIYPFKSLVSAGILGILLVHIVIYITILLVGFFILNSLLKLLKKRFQYSQKYLIPMSTKAMISPNGAEILCIAVFPDGMTYPGKLKKSSDGKNFSFKMVLNGTRITLHEDSLKRIRFKQNKKKN